MTGLLLLGLLTGPSLAPLRAQAFDADGVEAWRQLRIRLRRPGLSAPNPPRRSSRRTLSRPRTVDRRSLRARALPMAGAVCLRRLRQAAVPFVMASPRRGVKTPVRLTGAVAGVRIVPMWGRRLAIMDCRFALVLVPIARMARRAGFDEIRTAGFYSYRRVAGSRRLSRHANGLAVDIIELRGPGGLRANIKRDWPRARGRPGDCVAGVPQGPGRRLRQFVCALEASGRVYQVLTPDSDRAHHNHLHVSGLRVGDRPLRRRFAGRRVPVQLARSRWPSRPR